MKATPQGAASEPDRSGGIVLVDQASTERSYLDEGDFDQQGEASDAEQSDAAADTLAAALPASAAESLAGLLPSGEESLTNGEGLADILPGAGGLTGGGRPWHTDRWHNLHRRVRC